MSRRKKRPDHPYPRIGGQPPLIVGQDSSWWTDLYHWLMRISWPMLFLSMGGFYLALNAIFGLLYTFDPKGIANAREGGFVDGFLMSVQTLGALHGNLAPQSFYANSLATAESFAGILQTAIATGIVFARFSRAKARVLFSDYAVITQFEGVPALMFRVANQRGNQILEAEITVTLARQTVTREGHRLRRLDELQVLRRRSPLFALSWTVIHAIDESSPLRGYDRDRLMRDEAEIVVILGGKDEAYLDRIYARHSYVPGEIHWNKRFTDILGVTPDGRRRMLDLRKFHATEDDSGA